MTDPSLHDGARVGSEEAGRPLDPVALHRSLMTPVSAVGFWSAIVLPFLYVPLLFSGLRTGNELVVFLGLLALHLAALVVGRSYRPD